MSRQNRQNLRDIVAVVNGFTIEREIKLDGAERFHAIRLTRDGAFEASYRDQPTKLAAVLAAQNHVEG